MQTAQTCWYRAKPSPSETSARMTWWWHLRDNAIETRWVLGPLWLHTFLDHQFPSDKIMAQDTFTESLCVGDTPQPHSRWGDNP